MFEIETNRIEQNSEELHNQLLKLKYNGFRLEELLHCMREDELFEEVQLELRKECDRLNEETESFYNITESLYEICNAYNRCEKKNLEYAEGTPKDEYVMVKDHIDPALFETIITDPEYKRKYRIVDVDVVLL